MSTATGKRPKRSPAYRHWVCFARHRRVFNILTPAVIGHIMPVTAEEFGKENAP
jgi:hypothetical protein